MGWGSWVAIGDSFTEGLDDADGFGGFRGWADRLAELMAERDSNFRYANLAIRGKMLSEIIAEQVPLAIEARPDLVTLCAGGNDLIVPGSDVDELAGQLEQAIVDIQTAGSEVLIFAGPDPKAMPMVRRVRAKVAIYNEHLHAIADRHGARIVDLWAMHVLGDARAWSDDRLHFSPEGHRRIALRAAEVLGVPTEQDWREPWPPQERITSWFKLRKADLDWTRVHLMPWVKRHIKGESMGDGVAPKRPELRPLSDIPVND
ncbi:SGNH/GDSL hydrolase family protein [Kibdelosporangium philippinense]|uniref:SGNH/GDSL hydrolase family protein n=1 Tax=Kibdelosporangium philippinense TaxID=211113 RepID=A0ABS8ZTM3_9PSEU|nr:SGNH/GDSL hydrolase family protein [Kibdelosporangium philippinense]MCE7009162.1 SGNH/GDSL hydrolase family protein [Kibdelosporangium philippinense]